MKETASQISLRADRLVASGQFQPAIPLYRKALEHDPNRPDDWFNLAVCLRRAGEDKQALEAYRQALKHGVSGPEEVHLNRAVILSDQLNRPQDALAALKTALELRPTYAAALLNLGNLHEELGQAKEAIVCYQRLLSKDSEDGSHRAHALARLAHLEPPGPNDQDRFQALEQAASREALNPTDAASLFMALAQAHDRVDQVDAAYRAMSKGKSLLAQQGPHYRAADVESRVDRLIEAFSAPQSAPKDSNRTRPRLVFILGLYRSGSSLIEQMLSAHPDVLTGGELDILPRLFGNPFTSDQSKILNLESHQLDRLRERYWQLLGQRFSDLTGAAVVTDKRLDNHFLVGVLARLFPDARFIHTQRHPIDNALSIFMQHLDSTWVPYANRLDDICHFSIQTWRLIQHWETVLPGRVLECHYDRLVREPEAVLKSLLTFLDLPWDARCLNFHQQAGAVKTASYWQVRNPLYQRASGRWKRYKHHLETLQEQLKPLMEVDEPRADFSS